MNYADLKKAVEAAGHVFFDSGVYNLNLVGVRTDDDAANSFNDWMYVAYRDQRGEGHALAFTITTDPGVAYRVNPINMKGAGIIVPGQHRGVWKLGVHKSLPALVQVKPVFVYRDDDRDSVLDFDDATIERVLGGFNCHRSSSTGTSTIVGRWSAGCQVFANCYDHNMLMALAYRSAKIHGDSFSYTLLTEAEATRKPIPPPRRK